MWLIDTSTLQLRFFITPPRNPGYAILSHTWGDEEVTFQEISTRGSSDIPKKGWEKLTKTCHLARDDGKPYAWVDTCCIDKTSSAELSEAINSMFEWYKLSAVCYVFLDDIDFPMAEKSGKPGMEPGTPEFRNRLRSARWFTRGWTLQELIAPSNIVFYDKFGKKLGCKADIVEDLIVITNIDREVLLGRTDILSMIPVARKMSWAALRKTTRAEDMAYCLLGIFDINLPLLYGEGAKAFLRLQQEIARSTNDLSLFAWTLPRGPLHEMIHFEHVSGVFAPSPKEFLNGHSVRAPGWGLEQHVEFSLTNRGLRINSNILELEEGDTRLVLDCLVTDRDADSGTSWLEAKLKKIGSLYVRQNPYALVRNNSRPRIAPGPRAAWLKKPAFLATTIMNPWGHLIPNERLKPSELFYTESLRRCVEKTQTCDTPFPGGEYTLAAPLGKINDFFPTAIGQESLGPRFKAGLASESLFKVKEGLFWAELGSGSSRSHHLFEFKGVPLALVWCQEPGSMIESDFYPPWAVILRQDTCLAGHDEQIRHPDVFRNSASGPEGMSEEVRSNILHDYVFQWYSNDVGGYRTDDIPTSVLVAEMEAGKAQAMHEIKVHAALNKRYYTVSLILSHRQLPGHEAAGSS